MIHTLQRRVANLILLLAVGMFAAAGAAPQEAPVVSRAVAVAVPPAPPAAVPVEFPNPGFEAVATAGRPAGWDLPAGPLPAGNSVAVSLAGPHSGKRGLMIRHAAPAETTVASAPVALEVGRLYRLSGWIRAEGAFTDPSDRYPTSLPACLSMASFPFTNNSPAAGADASWREVSVLFLATRSHDRVQLHLGRNGPARGAAWFDDLRLERVDSIAAFIPPETVRWFGPAYRYDDRGWIFVHIQGEPYERGYQFGFLVGEEIAEYARKLAIRQNAHDPAAGWEDLRFQTDALMFRRYEPEYQTEMKGIADGAAKAGAKIFDRAPDAVDVAVLNSVIDLGQMKDALRKTRSALSGINFLKTEDELLIKEENHKCSAFAATGSATADGRPVFGQLFMWNGYTGVHWDVLLDVQPAQGHRFVMQTFPGGLHSGSDFYINDAGLVVGETTVAQTPYDDRGTPQSNRIRKAIQYASSVDELVAIMTDRNNGQYTNEWPFANVKTGEVGIFLLGTEKWRVWRSSQKDFPAGLTDFYWCNNNGKDLEVRKEYITNPDNAPVDLAFRPWNRDLAFVDFYNRTKGKIDAVAGVNFWATSPINRPHACDGKVTTGEMADRLAFLAHAGKVTLREKFVGSRFIADLPGAEPSLTLGYSVDSPIFVTERLQAEHAGAAAPPAEPKDPETDLSAVADAYKVDKRALWRSTIVPASAAENWLTTASAAYWRMLNDLPKEPKDAAPWLAQQLAELHNNYLYTVSREGDLAPLAAALRYDRYADYNIPRVKGTFALHQLRLMLGNEKFCQVMDALYTQLAGQSATTDEFIAAAEKAAGQPLREFLLQWLDRTGLPDPAVEARVLPGAKEPWQVEVRVRQSGAPYRLFGTVDVVGKDKTYRRSCEVQGAETVLTFDVPELPTAVVFNTGGDFPAAHERFYTLGSFFEDFHHTRIVYGTSRQIEANRTLAGRWQEVLADTFSEILPPLRKDCELGTDERAGCDLMVLGPPEDNTVAAELAGRIPGLEMGRNWFRWQGKTYGCADDGLLVVVPNPWNPQRVLYLLLANSAQELYQMTKKWQLLPSWAVFRSDQVKDKGFHAVERFRVELVAP